MRLVHLPAFREYTRAYELEGRFGAALFVNDFLTAVRGIVLEEDMHDPDTIYCLESEPVTPERNNIGTSPQWLALRWARIRFSTVHRTTREIDMELLETLARKVL